jgi:nitrous oxidase accessory protein NosD
MKKSFLLIFLISSFAAFAQADFEKKLQTKLILAEDGTTIEIEAGTFFLTKSLSLEGKKNITLRGKGIDKTVLSFKNQIQGAEGIKITNCEYRNHNCKNCSNKFTVKHFIYNQ